MKSIFALIIINAVFAEQPNAPTPLPPRTLSAEEKLELAQLRAEDLERALAQQAMEKRWKELQKEREETMARLSALLAKAKAKIGCETDIDVRTFLCMPK